MSIIISRAGKNAAKVERSVIEQEDYLQRYIFDNPDTLPFGEIRTDLRLLILAREFAVPSGYIDALGVDDQGVLYVIETKRYKNPDKRLVVAQMLDYGASLWRSYSDANEFISQLEPYVNKAFGVGLAPKLSHFFGLEPDAAAVYVEQVKQNIGQGVFRFIVLMDRLDDRLKDLISFVNANSRFDVLGVELDFYRHTDFEIIIPRLYGSETKKEVASPHGAKRVWNEQSFFDDLQAKCGPQVTQQIRKLYDWAKEHGAEIGFGRGTQTGSFTPKFPVVSSRPLFVVYSNGTIELYFKYLTELPESAVVATRFGRLLRDAGFSLPDDFALRYLNLKRSEWSERMDRFIATLQQLLNEPRR